jgi:hypothetical protein
VVDVAPPTTTVTSTSPAVHAGLVAVQLVVELQVTAVPAAVAKLTVVEPEVVENPVPVIVTTVPPARGPEVGLMLVTVGVGVTAAATPTSSCRSNTAKRRRPPTPCAALESPPLEMPPILFIKVMTLCFHADLSRLESPGACASCVRANPESSTCFVGSWSSYVKTMNPE